jgi:hypothetical protein
MTLRMRVLALVVALALALALALGGCGRDGTPDAGGGNAAKDTRTETRSTPRRATGPDIDAVAYWFRYEGALLGAAPLRARFREDGVAWGDSFTDPGEREEPDALSRFLAASRPEILCRDSGRAVIVFHGPFHEAVLVTRWSLGRSIRLQQVSVARAAVPSAPWWLEALATAGGEDAVQDALAAIARARSAAAAGAAPCEPRAMPPDAVTPLVTPRERGLPLAGLYHGPAELARLHRGVLALFNRGEPEVLEALLGAAQGDLVRGLATANPRMQLAPVYRMSVAEGRHERHLVVYADLLMGGRYLLVSAAMPRAEAGAPAGGVEIRMAITRL